MKATFLIFFIVIYFAFDLHAIAIKDSKVNLIKSTESSIETETEISFIGQIPLVGPIINGVVAVIPKPIPKRIEFDVPFPLSLFG